MARLGDICTFQSGGTPNRTNYSYFGGSIPWITTVALNGGNIDSRDAVEWITDKAIQESAAKIVPQNSIMIGTRVGIGKVAINSVPMSTSQDIVSLLNIDAQSWDKKFICNFILAKNNFLLSQARGATIKGIKIETLANLQIPDVSIDEQRHITVVLDKVSDLIAKRRQQLDKLDELVKSRFIEMFGEPEQNPFGWQIKKLAAVVSSITAGWSANGETRPREAGEKAVLKVSAVTQGLFKPDEYKVIPTDVQIKKYIYPKKGDLLFSRANTRELVGATAIIEEDYPDLLLPDKLWKVIFTSEMDVYYAKHILSTQAIRNVFSSQSTGTSGSMYNVSVEKFRETLIPVPPIMLQREFANFVRRVDKPKLAIQKSLEKLEMLKKALMQEYFG